MTILLCEGCGHIILNDLFNHHLLVGNEAPTGGLNKEHCPLWLQRQDDNTKNPTKEKKE